MASRSPFRETWKDYLSFTKRERRGIFALLLIIILQIAVLIYMRYFYSVLPAPDYSQFEKEVDSFYASALNPDDTLSESNEGTEILSKKNTGESAAQKSTALFAFNPNGLSFENWQRLGFSEKQIHVIKNYESKGGKFRTKEDVMKMYCISEKEYKRIEAYIDIPVAAPIDGEKDKKKFVKTPVIIDIGSADSAELVMLRGIGPAFARRISIYRNKLGGFISKEQLKEVWGISDSLYKTLLPEISLNDSQSIRKINLNVAEFNDLKNHPYIGYQLASMICNYRKQHNGFHALDEIKKLPLVNDQLYSKLAPYLMIE